nr:MAG TPA: hypothetical protein [Caudoviricetes sp.]
MAWDRHREGNRPCTRAGRNAKWGEANGKPGLCLHFLYQKGVKAE